MTLDASIQALRDQLARGDASDMKHVVDVREAFVALKETLAAEAELAEALACAQRALDLLSGILWQEADDPGADYASLATLLADVEATRAALADGVQGPGATTARPSPLLPTPEPPAEALDEELLGMFLTSSEEHLETIERLALEIEEATSEDALDHLRRVVHTIKGECGVLSLNYAQGLFHLAEDRLDDVLRSGGRFPAEGILALADWLKLYLTQLGSEPGAAPPDGSALLAAFDGESLEPESRAQRSVEPRAEDTGERPRPAAAAPAATTRAPAGDARSSAAAAFLAGHGDDEPVFFEPDVYDDPMMGDVLTEGRAHLEDAEAAALELEGDPGGATQIDRIFRAFHTIKGVAGFMNLTPIVQVAHWSETLLDDFRKGYQPCRPEHVSLVLRARDTMSQLLDALVGESAPSIGEVRTLLGELERATVGEGGTAPAEVEPARPVAPATAAPAATAAGEAAEPDAQSELEAATETDDAEEAGEPVVELPGSRATVDARSPRSEPRTPEATAAAKGRGAPKIEQSVKVGTRRLDQLVDMVGELVIAQQMVSQDDSLAAIRSDRLNRNLAQMAKITRDLQESAMSLRMVPLRSTFQKMSRLVRDVSRKAGRSVVLEITGEDTELDRTVVEEIGDPLIHLIRNAIDHGLEPPEERLAAGKGRDGYLLLRAYHQGGSIVIEIKDDGRGLNRDRILAKALERGLLPSGVRGEDLPDSEVFRLIFAPGFSTAEKVTDISGRGVGMDVVRRNIEALRGRIEIRSQLGQGTTFFLRLPLTLAIIDGMIVRVGGSRYVVPTLSIEQSFQPHAEQLHRVLESGLAVQVRETLLPVRSLRDLFALPTGVEDPTAGILIILEAHGERTCVLVDEILYQQQVVIKSIGRAVPDVQGISGAAILGDGTVALILDVDGLLTEAAPQPA